MKNVINWNKQNYQKLIKYLYDNSDKKYKQFQSGLAINNDYLIGVSVPKLKKIAKEIAKTDYQKFIYYNTHQTYEEILLHGLILGYIKIDFSILKKLFDDYITYIDNWALCDIVVTNLHIWKKNLNEGLIFIKKCLENNNQWHKRVGYVLLLNYYILPEYIDNIYLFCDENTSDDYYVKMAIAWLISYCYIKYPKQTLNYIKNNKLDNWIHNKAIQKIRESKQVSLSKKDELIKYRR